MQCSLRNKYAGKLHDSGHLVFPDTPQALSLLAMAGLRVVSYRYTPCHAAPSGGKTALARLVRAPARRSSR